MNDIFRVVLRPRDVLLARLERMTYGMHARNNPYVTLVNLGEDRCANARHDTHVHHGVRRISELHTYLRHGRAYRPHAEGQYVHGPPAHATREKRLEPPAHHNRRLPVVGGTCVVLAERADE